MCTCLQYRLELYMGTYADQYTHTKKCKYTHIQLYNCMFACSTAHIRYTHTCIDTQICQNTDE